MNNDKRPLVSYVSTQSIPIETSPNYLSKIKNALTKPRLDILKIPQHTIPKNKEYHLGNCLNKDYWLTIESCYKHIALVGDSDAIGTMDLYLAKQSIRYGQPLIFIEHGDTPEVASTLIRHAKEASREKAVFYMNLINNDNAEYFFNYNFDTFTSAMWAELLMKSLDSQTHFLPLFYTAITGVIQAIKEKEQTITFELCKQYFKWEQLLLLSQDDTLQPSTLYLIKGFWNAMQKFPQPEERFSLYQTELYKTCNFYLAHNNFKSNTLINWPRVAFNEIFSEEAPIFIVSLPKKNTVMAKTIYYLISQMLINHLHEKPTNKINVKPHYPMKHLVLRNPLIECFPLIFPLAGQCECSITSSISNEQIDNTKVAKKYIDFHHYQCYSFPIRNYYLKKIFITQIQRTKKAQQIIHKYFAQSDRNKENWRRNLPISPESYMDSSIDQFILLFQDNIAEIKLIPKV